MIEIASFGVPIKKGPRRTVVIGTYVVEMENEGTEVVVRLSSYPPLIEFTCLSSDGFKLYEIINTTGAGVLFSLPKWDKSESGCDAKPFRLIEV